MPRQSRTAAPSPVNEPRLTHGTTKSIPLKVRKELCDEHSVIDYAWQASRGQTPEFKSARRVLEEIIQDCLFKIPYMT